MSRFAAATLALAILSGCQVARDTPAIEAAGAAGGLPIVAFAQGACGDCHAVEKPFLSPNPAAPAFGDIANRPENSPEALATWLLDAHNYPEAMDFELDRAQAEALARYILGLRKAAPANSGA